MKNKRKEYFRNSILLIKFPIVFILKRTDNSIYLLKPEAYL